MFSVTDASSRHAIKREQFCFSSEARLIDPSPGGLIFDSHDTFACAKYKLLKDTVTGQF